MKEKLLKISLFYYLYKLLKIFRNKKPSTHFGEFGEDPFIDSIDDHPNIIEVKKEASEKASHFGGSWHSDWSFQKKPPSATLLHSKTIPPIGGDTLLQIQLKLMRVCLIQRKKILIILR